jgi:DNA-binding response OmpR family regulator
MKVLVVEDEYKIANSIKKGFEQESWICDVCNDGEEGFDLASTNTYDCIVLDLMLPKKDGLTVSKELRKENVHTPILMLTAKGELSDKVIGFDSGADDYLVKPFAFEELVARVKALSRRPKKIDEIGYKVKDLFFDTKKQSITLNGKDIILSRKEYQLLEYLLKNKDKVVSKEEIINHVWDYDTNILPNTVEVFIKYIRNKIGSNYIKTIRGFGYKINS